MHAHAYRLLCSQIMPPRKRNKGDAGVPSVKRARVSWSRSSFGAMMEATGMKLGGEQQNTLAIEPTLLQKKLSLSFKNQQDTNKAVKEFCDGFADYCSDTIRFRVALMPTNVAIGSNIKVRGCGLDSLVRILLGVDCLQPLIIDMLLGKFSEHSTTTNSSIIDQSPKITSLILNQLKMLDQLVQGKEFCGKLMEVVRVAPSELQREIVTCLPDIVDDPQHDDAAILLKSLLSDKPELTASVMDALSNLIIADHIAAEVLEIAMQQLQTAEFVDLPTIIKFIMQYVTSKNSQELIGELRANLSLDFSPLHSYVVSSTPNPHTTAKKASAKLSSHFVVFDTIAAITRIRKPVADGWIKAIEAVTEPDEHRVIDVLVLFFLHSISGRTKSVETLFANKIRTGCINDDLLSSVFGSHAKALTEYFSSILVLCDNLFYSTSPSVSLFAASLYQHLFSAFDIPYKQEVVGALVTHVNNGGCAEVDRALDTVLKLVHHDFPIMQQFAVLIKGALDRLEYLSTAQIRKLYDVLTELGFTDVDRQSAIQDEMRILIRKQLLHSEQRYRHMGIIGAVMSIKQLNQTSEDRLSSQEALFAHKRELTKSLLEEVMQTCSTAVDAMILFCEEMAAVAMSLEAETLKNLTEQVTSSFQDDYLIEASDPLPLGLELLYSLDEVEEGLIALNLQPLIGGAGCENVRSMAARFHLLRVCEAAVNKNLEGIDALLGCPVLLYPVSKLSCQSVDNMSLQERQEVCLALFHTLNWFRELVSAFSSEVDVDMRGKVLLRLENITTLEGFLEKAMAATPGWCPPNVNSWELPDRYKKKKNDVSLASITAATINVDKDTTLAADKSLGFLSVDRAKPFFRELDLAVFKSLGFGILSRTFLDSEQHTHSRDELKLRPPQLVFLLEDLYAKISSTFSVFGSKAANINRNKGCFHSNGLVKMMADILPMMCEYFESTCAFFQTQLDDNDGIVDMRCNHVDYPHYCLFLHLLLKSMTVFLAWPSMQDREYNQILSKCVETLALRRQTTPTGSTLPALAMDVYKYLESFVGVIPTLSCAHSLGKLLVTVAKVCKAKHVQQHVAKLCGEILQRKWTLCEQTSVRKEATEYLLKYHLEWATEPLYLIDLICGEAAVELIGDQAVEESTKYPTLSRSSFSWYYRVMIATLVHQVKMIPAPKKATLANPEELNEYMQILEVATRIFFILVNLVKSFYKSAVLSSCLKHGRLFLEAFLKSGMPVLDELFKSQRNDVLALLKNLQQSTRMLQHYCGHSKGVKDTNLINNVPLLKKSLEAFIFKVKEVLSNHNCEEAFWMGNLKNRDIKGREIPSQQSGNEENQESDEDNSASVSSGSTNYTGAEEPMDQAED